MTLVLDAGALIALERRDRAMWCRFKAALLAGEVPITHGGIVGQVWRAGGPRQAMLANALASIVVRPLDEKLGRAAGGLLAAARGSDVIDAALVLLADDDDQIVTSDVDDLEPLARAGRRHVEFIQV